MVVTVTNEQLTALKPYVLDNYTDGLILHCNKLYPHLERTLSRERLKLSLKEAVYKAEESGFTQRGSVQFYIDMLVVFGMGFETDPQYPWIQQNLVQNKKLSELERSMALYQQVHLYLNEITGEQDQHLLASAVRLQKLTLDNMNIERKTYIKDVHTLLYNVYPQKYQQSSKDDLTNLVRQGTIKAQAQYQLEKPNHAALIVLLMFVLGHQFDEDLFQPWIHQEKIQQYIGDNERLINKIVTRAKIWLDSAIKANTKKSNVS